MPSDYAQLAKRISAITTKCLLSAMVLVAGLGFGRQVLRWWAADEAAPTPAGPAGIADGLGDPWRLHLLQFGDQPWSLCRQSISGDSEAAATALRAVCREVVGHACPPDEPPGEAENRFLSRLAARDPAEQEPGKWRLYDLSEAFPMLVGTRQTAVLTHAPSEGSLAATSHRMVVWGLALPAGPKTWTLFTFQPEASAARSSAVVPEVPIPPECRRTLSMRVAGGGAMLAFDGPQEPRTWIDFYDGWFAARRWRTVWGWQHSGPRWHARYTAAGEERAGCVDVHFGNADQGRSTGLVIVNPPASPLGKKQAAGSGERTRDTKRQLGAFPLSVCQRGSELFSGGDQTPKRRSIIPGGKRVSPPRPRGALSQAGPRG
jgi:hypothetical protein